MTIKVYPKPNWIDSSAVVATINGWVNTDNHNEVLIAIPHLDKRMAIEDDETTNPNAPSVTIINSNTIKIVGLPNAEVTFTYGENDPIVDTLDADGTLTATLEIDLISGNIISITQKDPDLNVSAEGLYTVKKLKGAITLLEALESESQLSISGKLINIANDQTVDLYLGTELIETVSITVVDGEKTFIFEGINGGSVFGQLTFTIQTTDVSDKLISKTISAFLPEPA